MTSFAELTTTRVGGLARTVIEARSRAELIDAYTGIETYEPVLVLGEGSNTIVGDDGFDGTVILVRSQGIETRNDDGRTVDVRVQAGHNWDAFVAWAIDNGLAGVEGMSGIPGTVGAAPVQNIGAYGQELESVILGVEFLEAGETAPIVLAAGELGFAFRTSIFKQGRQGIILSVDLRLTRAEAGSAAATSEPIAYEQLATALGLNLGETAELHVVRERVLELRRSKGMLLDDNDADTNSTGSFFMNPIVRTSFALDLPAESPRWPVGDDGKLVKLSAAWLIENAGVPKGFSLPGSRASVSTKHTLALTNRGGASTEEILELARYIQAVVQSNFGLILQPEAMLINAEI
jgi:UDP-N-acetylmuramate dehydrogenase